MSPGADDPCPHGKISSCSQCIGEQVGWTGSDEQYDALMAVLGRLEGERSELDQMLGEARGMQHESLAHWEDQGYVVECRLGTRFRSELLGAIGQAARRVEQGEDVKLLLARDEKHAIIMVRDRGE